jgi:hypothetical protein
MGEPGPTDEAGRRVPQAGAGDASEPDPLLPVPYETPAPPTPAVRRWATIIGWATAATAVLLAAGGVVAYLMVVAAGKGGHAGWAATARQRWLFAAAAAAVSVVAFVVSRLPRTPDRDGGPGAGSR